MALTYVLKKGAEEIEVDHLSVAGSLAVFIGLLPLAPVAVAAGTTTVTVACPKLIKGQKVKVVFTPAAAPATPETVEETVPGGKVGAWAGRNWGNVSSVLISIAALGVVIWFTLYVKNQIADIASGMGTGSGSGMTASGSAPDLATFKAELMTEIRAEFKPVIDRLDATDRALNGWDEPPTPPTPIHHPGLIDRVGKLEHP